MNNNLSNNILSELSLKDGKKLVIRNPKVEDAEGIIKYLNVVGGESDNLLFGKDEITFTVEQEAKFIENINNDPNISMIVGIIDGSIVSVAQISGSSRKRIVHNMELAISVKMEYWNMGIGSAVMRELISIAKENKITNVSLGVKAGNSKAIRLYEKFGFEKVGVHKNYFNINGTYDDEILMDLYL